MISEIENFPITDKVFVVVSEFRFQVISDIHLEMRKKIPQLVVSAPVLCLCGDIGYPVLTTYWKFIEWCSNNYECVFVIAGNHEFYHKKFSMQQVQEHMVKRCTEFHNVVYLENKTVLLRDVNGNELRVFGATMWTNTLVGINDMQIIQQGMNDYSNITFTYAPRERRLITPMDTSFLHLSSKKALERELNEQNVIPLVVLTHHLPSHDCIADELRQEQGILNHAYASHLDQYIKPPIVLWAFGHSHKSRNMMINGVKMVSNPMGYPDEKDTGYNNCHSINLDVSK